MVVVFEFERRVARRQCGCVDRHLRPGGRLTSYCFPSPSVCQFEGERWWRPFAWCLKSSTRMTRTLTWNGASVADDRVWKAVVSNYNVSVLGMQSYCACILLRHHQWRECISALFLVSYIPRLMYPASHVSRASSVPGLIYSKSQASIVSQPSGLSDHVLNFRHVSASSHVSKSVMHDKSRDKRHLE